MAAASQFRPEYGDMGNDERGLAAGALGRSSSPSLPTKRMICRPDIARPFDLCSHTSPGGRTREDSTHRSPKATNNSPAISKWP